MKFSSGGRRLITANAGQGGLQVWDMATGQAGQSVDRFAFMGAALAAQQSSRLPKICLEAAGAKTIQNCDEKYLSDRQSVLFLDAFANLHPADDSALEPFSLLFAQAGHRICQHVGENM